MALIFLSHSSAHRAEAVRFEALLKRFSPPETEVFNTSGWESLNPGAPWLRPILSALDRAEAFVGMVAADEDFGNEWILFEAAYALGKGYPALIFLFGGLKIELLREPLATLFLVKASDSNLVQRALTGIGLTWSAAARDEFAHLFRECSHYNRLPPVYVCPIN